MRRTAALCIVALLAGLALAGCATNAADREDPSTAPQAMVAASPLSPQVNEPVSLQWTAARPGDVAVWNFGDGSPTATGASASHTYTAPGQYIVLLEVTGAAGQKVTNDAALTYITVTDPNIEMESLSEEHAPVAVAASSAQVAKVGAEVAFDATGSGAWVANPEHDPSDPVSTPSYNPPFVASPDAVSATWSFGDGATATGLEATHAFAAPGLYPVTLEVKDANGRASKYVISVRVLPEPPATPGVRNPGVLTVATIGEPESLDPAYDYESSGGYVLQHVYETLYFYKRDSAEQLEPRLASAMPTYNAQRTELTIPIRENVRFHNGETLTAHDVKFSLDRVVLMNDPDGPAWILGTILGADEYMHSEGTAEDRAAYLATGGVSVVDDHTVRIRLAYPDPAFLYKLAFNVASIVSAEGVCAHAEPDFVSCLPPPGETRHPWMDTHEVGTGPFRLEAWIPGQQIILKRFDAYWGAKPALEKVIIQKVGDINTRLLMLFSGQADDVYVPVDHDVDVIGKPGVKVTENPGWTVSFIGFNQKFCGGPDASTYDTCMAANGADAPKGADGKPDPLFFADPNMRAAWTLAFDYDAYHRDILKEHGRMLNGPLPKGIFGYDETIPQPKRDLAAAKAALARTQHADGFSVTIFYNSDNTIREKTADLLARNLRELGPDVHVETRALDWSTAFLPKQRALALPVFYLGWGPDYAFPDNYVVTFAHSQTGIFSKRIGYENAELDALLDRLALASDEEELRRGYSQAVRELNEDNVFLWLGQGSNFNVVRDWVHGYYYNPMHAGVPHIGDLSAITKR